MFLNGTSFEHNYIEILKHILHEGKTRNVRGFKTMEITGFSYTTENPLSNILMNPVRKINHGFRAAEFLWIVSGRNDTEMIGHYNKNIGGFSDNGSSYRGAYGPSFQQQLPYLLDCFKKDLYTRQAIISIWNRNPGQSKDVPCTLSMQFLVDDKKKLDMVVTMRSNDAWLGLPYDFFNFTMIQNYISCLLDLEVGTYTHQAGSMHLYDTHYQQAHDATNVMHMPIRKSAQMTGDQLSNVLDIEKDLRNRNPALATTLGDPWADLAVDILNYNNKKHCTSVQ